MNLLDRINIVKRIRDLEREYAARRRRIEDLVARHSDPPHTPEDFGITREIRRLRELVEDMGESQ